MGFGKESINFWTKTDPRPTKTVSFGAVSVQNAKLVFWINFYITRMDFKDFMSIGILNSAFLMVFKMTWLKFDVSLCP